jgi:glycosyltransferase involved in cell wall biosynthesis
MQVLTLCYEYPPLGGGGGIVVDGLIRELTKKGHRIQLVTMGFKGLSGREDLENFTIHRIPCLRAKPDICHPHEMLSYLIAAFPQTLQISRQQCISLIHAHFIFPDGILAHLLHKHTGIPFIISAHGSDVPGYNPDRFILLHKMLAPLWRTIVAASSRIICMSRYLESLVTECLPTAETAIIPNGFDLQRFRADRPKKKRILVASRMFQRKGIQHFLHALEGINTNYEVHVFGDGPLMPELERIASSLACSITFHGFVDNRSDMFKVFLETSKIFVLPSESENFPVSLLEAMAAGMAIITTRGTGCEEVVGDCALLVNYGDVRGIRRALETCLKDTSLCQRLGDAARQRLEKKYSWNTVGQEYLHVYDRVKDRSYGEKRSV